MKDNDNSTEHFKGEIEIIGDSGPAELINIPSGAKVSVGSQTQKEGSKKSSKPNKTITISGSNSIVILRHRGLANDVKELEDKYSEKFGCKVIILESNIDYVDTIDG